MCLFACYPDKKRFVLRNDTEKFGVSSTTEVDISGSEYRLLKLYIVY